jgi:Tol biopolymer transport system component
MPMTGWRRLAVPAVLVSAVIAAGARATLGSPAMRALSAEPELVGPGVLSTPLDELNAAFTPDGSTMYYSISSPGPSADQFGTVVVSRLRSGKWTPPEVAPFSGQFSDYDPFVSPDGSRLYFASNRPNGTAKQSRADYDIWFVDRSGGGEWGTPRNAGPAINSRAPEYYPSVASDGTLYFSTVRPETKGHFNLYRSRVVNGQLAAPENLGPTLNGAYDNIDNVIAPDQSFIIFASYGRPDGLGNGDLYVSFYNDGAWTAPKNLGAPVNSVALEYTPSLSPDLKYLYWTSNRGFADRQLTHRLTIAELRDSLASIRNGNGNIYRTPLQPLLDAAR